MHEWDVNSKLHHRKDKKAYLKLGLYDISKLELKNERLAYFWTALIPFPIRQALTAIKEKLGTFKDRLTKGRLECKT